MWWPSRQDYYCWFLVGGVSLSWGCSSPVLVPLSSLPISQLVHPRLLSLPCLLLFLVSPTLFMSRRGRQRWSWGNRHLRKRYILALTQQCKNVQVSSRVKGCFGEVLRFKDRCVCENNGDSRKCYFLYQVNENNFFWCNFFFLFQLIPAELHAKPANMSWQHGVLWGWSQLISHVLKLPCVLICFDCKLMKLAL